MIVNTCRPIQDYLYLSDEEPPPTRRRGAPRSRGSTTKTDPSVSRDRGRGRQTPAVSPLDAWNVDPATFLDGDAEFDAH